jgi:UDPglucose 6-dehydrogenase
MGAGTTAFANRRPTLLGGSCGSWPTLRHPSFACSWIHHEPRHPGSLKRGRPHDRVSLVDVAVLGAGYVGAITAACLADRGHDVTVVEVAGPRLAAYQEGRVPLFEPGLDDLFQSMLAAGRLRVTDDVAAALNSRRAVVICVGTPLSPDGEADLRQVEAACRAISASGSEAVVVIRSTLPIGTTAIVGEWLGRPALANVVTNPEFLAQGSGIRDFLAPSRIVIGTQDGQPSAGSGLLEELYAGIDAPILVTDFASAEMIKNVANAFLATKLSFVNEVADLCEAFGANVEAVVRGIGLDPRIGATYLRPGIGFGGSCLPKELANLVRLGRERGLPMRMLGAAGTANDERSAYLVQRLEDALGSFDGRRVALLGLAFKPLTDDTRYSPAVSLAMELIKRGAEVVAHDPAVPAPATASLIGLRRASTVARAVAGADLVVHATEWPEYRALDWKMLGKLARSQVMFDGRNALDADALRLAGWRVLRVGSAVPDVPPMQAVGAV